MTVVKYGLPTPEKVAAPAAREVLRAIVDGGWVHAAFAETASSAAIVLAGVE